jgi:preprotein translocase subunit SecE
MESTRRFFRLKKREDADVRDTRSSAGEKVDKKLKKALDLTDSIKTRMRHNIDQQLQNMETTEEIEAKSIALEKSAQRFKKDSKTLKRKMIWRNVKAAAAATLAVAGTVTLIVLL